MQRCERCARVIPDDEPRCPECGPAPARLDAPPAPRPSRDARTSDAPRLAAVAAHPVETVAPHAPARSPNTRLLDAHGAHGDPGPSHDAAHPSEPESGGGHALAVAAALEHKAAPFAQERTGTQRRESVAWARGGGEGAKIVPLRRMPNGGERAPSSDPPDARRDTPSKPPPPDARRDTPSEPPPPDARRDTPLPRASELPARPLVLASESLRADLAPNTPGRSAIRVAALALGAGGALAAGLVGGPGFGTLTVAAALALVGALGLAPLAYRGRALALFAVAAPTLLSATVLAAPHGGVPHGGLLGLTASGLAGALYFRAEYRASRLARGLIAAGVAAGVVWLAMSGALTALGAIEAAWQSWLPALLGATLAPMLLLAMLGFMTEHSTGGCGLWATALLVWLACYENAAHAAQVFPADASGPSDDWHIGAAMGAVATPLLAPIVALAVAQLLVIASGGGREDVDDTTQ